MTVHRNPVRAPKPAKAPRTLPVIDDYTTTVIEFLDDGPDDSGHRIFFAYWLSDSIGYSKNETGTHGQAFHTDPTKFIAGMAPGRTVRILEAVAR